MKRLIASEESIADIIKEDFKSYAQEKAPEVLESYMQDLEPEQFYDDYQLFLDSLQDVYGEVADTFDTSLYDLKETEIERVIDEAIYEITHDRRLFGYLYGYWERMLPKIGVIRPKDFLNLKDRIGTVVEIPYVIDEDNRDHVFVYIDGKVLVSDNNESHGALLNDYAKENGTELDSDYDRPDFGELQKKLKAKAVAFGHIANRVAFIDQYALAHCTLAQVKTAIKPFVEKVYAYGNDTVKRIANVSRI